MTTFPAYLQRLGISADADERTIRRAYARELKQIDQEADPEGFQALREAYDEALYWSRYRAEEFDGEATASAADVPAYAEAAETPAAAAAGLAVDLTKAASPPTGEPPLASGAGEAAALPADDPQALAADDDALGAEVFAEFLERCGRIAAGMPATDAAPWERELRHSLADARLISIIARDGFERRVAELLAAGWQPGHEALLVAATAVFDWENDRRRVASLGYAGAMLDHAIRQRTMFDLQPSGERARQRKLIQRLRAPEEPSTRELVVYARTLETLIARFPEWLALVANVPRIVDWRERASQVPAWRRKLTFTGWSKLAEQSYEQQQGWTVNWKWLIFLVVVAVVRCASDSSKNPGDSNGGGGKPAIQIDAGARQLHEQGNQQLDSGDYTGAIASYGKAIAAAPDFAPAYGARAQAYIHEEDFESAKRDVEKAASLDRASLPMLAARGLIALKERQHEDALADFTRGIQLAPDMAFFYTQRARAYEQGGQLKAALADVEESIRKQPQGNHFAYLLAAYLHKSAGDKDKAAEQAEAQITADGASPAAYVIAARIHELLDNKKQALAVLERGVAAAPSVSIHLHRAELLAASDVEGRRKAVDAALALAPKDYKALKMRADIERDARNFNAALAAYAALLAQEPDNSPRRIDLLMERAFSHAMQGNTAAAAKEIAAARAISTTSTQFNNMCWFLATRNVMLQDALDACTTALAKDAADAPTLDSKGFVLLRLQRYDEALAAYDAALAQRKQLPASLYGRGIVKRRLGRHQEAKADIDAAVAIDSTVAAEFASLGIK